MPEWLTRHKGQLELLPPEGILRSMETSGRQEQSHERHPHAIPGYIENKDAQLKRLRRIEGQCHVA